MTVLPIRTAGDPVLRRVTEPVQFVTRNAVPQSVETGKLVHQSAEVESTANRMLRDAAMVASRPGVPLSANLAVAEQFYQAEGDRRPCRSAQSGQPSIHLRAM